MKSLSSNISPLNANYILILSECSCSKILEISSFVEEMHVMCIIGSILNRYFNALHHIIDFSLLKPVGEYVIDAKSGLYLVKF